MPFMRRSAHPCRRQHPSPARANITEKSSLSAAFSVAEKEGVARLRAGRVAALTCHRHIIHSRSLRIPQHGMNQRKDPSLRTGLSFGGEGGIRPPPGGPGRGSDVPPARHSLPLPSNPSTWDEPKEKPVLADGSFLWSNRAKHLFCGKPCAATICEVRSPSSLIVSFQVQLSPSLDYECSTSTSFFNRSIDARFQMRRLSSLLPKRV